MLCLMPASLQTQRARLLVRQATKDNMVMVAGEIKTQAKLDYEKVIRG